MSYHEEHPKFLLKHTHAQDYKCCAQAPQLNQTSVTHMRSWYSNSRQSNNNGKVFGAAEFAPDLGVCNKTSNIGGAQKRFNGQPGTKFAVQQVKQKDFK